MVKSPDGQKNWKVDETVPQLMRYGYRNWFAGVLGTRKNFGEYSKDFALTQAQILYDPNTRKRSVLMNDEMVREGFDQENFEKKRIPESVKG